MTCVKLKSLALDLWGAGERYLKWVGGVALCLSININTTRVNEKTVGKFLVLSKCAFHFTLKHFVLKSFAHGIYHHFLLSIKLITQLYAQI